MIRFLKRFSRFNAMYYRSMGNEVEHLCDSFKRVFAYEFIVNKVDGYSPCINNLSFLAFAYNVSVFDSCCMADKIYYFDWMSCDVSSRDYPIGITGPKEI